MDAAAGNNTRTANSNRAAVSGLRSVHRPYRHIAATLHCRSSALASYSAYTMRASLYFVFRNPLLLSSARCAASLPLGVAQPTAKSAAWP